MISIETVLLVSLIVLLGLVMILASGPLARVGAKTNFLLPENEVTAYQRRKKRRAQQSGALTIALGLLVGVYFLFRAT